MAEQDEKEKELPKFDGGLTTVYFNRLAKEGARLPREGEKF